MRNKSKVTTKLTKKIKWYLIDKINLIKTKLKILKLIKNLKLN